MKDFKMIIHLNEVEDSYALIRDIIERYQFNTRVYCGFGLEVYQINKDNYTQMVVDWNNNEIRVNKMARG